MINRWMEITFILIIAYLILTNAFGFTSAVKSIASAYTGAVKVLQGR